MHKSLRVMHATKTLEVELASYRLKEVAYSWFKLWEVSCEEGNPLARWSEFIVAFIDHFLPAETKAARAAEFEGLRQGSLSVWEYHMKFTHLSKYAIYMLPIMEARVHRFMEGISPLVINEAAMAALNSDMNYGKIVAFAQAMEYRKLKRKTNQNNNNKTRSAGNLSGSYNGGNGGKIEVVRVVGGLISTKELHQDGEDTLDLTIKHPRPLLEPQEARARAEALEGLVFAILWRASGPLLHL
ncbi:uncharacterized protein [Nicotiana tomentosiformis]|uniref:uncharacterized protein n=1 Tax=Nicotiana tomentosiformis TaxID=4098 RepID=UPI00388CAEAC